MSTIASLVAAGLAALAVCLTLNAILSFTGGYRRELSMIRLQGAILGWMAVLLAVKVAAVLR